MTERFRLNAINKNYSIVLNGAYNIVDDGNILEGKEVVDLLNELVNENVQLKERNNRQAKHLAELYELMAKKDWESLTEIIDDFCSCEE